MIRCSVALVALFASLVSGQTVGQKIRHVTANVSAYGAVGDGVTDDGPAIDAALASGVSRIVFDAKTYRIATAVNETTDVELVGHKEGTILLCEVDGTSVLITGSATVRNIEFNGNDNPVVERMLQIGGTGSRILVDCCKFVAMSSDTFAQGLAITGDSATVRVSNCRFSGIRTLANGTIGDADGAVRGIYASCYGDELTIEKCWFRDINNRNAGNTFIMFEDADAIQIQNIGTTLLSARVDNCYFEDCGKRAVKIESEGQASVTNCRCVSTQTSAEAVQGSFDFNNTNPDTITRASGSWLTDGFTPYQTINVANASLSANNGSYVATNVTATTITLEATETITVDSNDTLCKVFGNAGMFYMISCASGDLFVENCHTTGEGYLGMVGVDGTTDDLCVVRNCTHSPGRYYNRNASGGYGGIRASNTQFVVSSAPEVIVENCRSVKTQGIINATAGDRWSLRGGHYKTWANGVFVLSGDEGTIENCLVEEEVADTPTLDFADNNPSLDTITRSTGCWIIEGYSAGATITVLNAETGANDGVYVIDSVTSKVITLTVAAALTTDAGDATATVGSHAGTNYMAYAANGAKRLVVRDVRTIGTFRDGVYFATQSTNDLVAIVTGNDFSSVSQLEIRGDAYNKLFERENVHNAVVLAGAEQSADPANPDEGKFIVWQSDGTGTGDDGDVLVKITAGGVTKTVTLVDFSAF